MTTGFRTVSVCVQTTHAKAVAQNINQTIQVVRPATTFHAVTTAPGSAVTTASHIAHHAILSWVATLMTFTDSQKTN